MTASGPDHVLIRVAVAADEPQIADTVSTAYGATEGPVVARLVKAPPTKPAAWSPARATPPAKRADRARWPGD